VLSFVLIRRKQCLPPNWAETQKGEKGMKVCAGFFSLLCVCVFKAPFGSVRADGILAVDVSQVKEEDPRG